MRLVFVSDRIPSELLRIVEFLNRQMDPAKVLAVEVRQFVGDGVHTLVPRVLGQTDPARDRTPRSSGRQPVSRSDFWEQFSRQRPSAEHAVVQRLEGWAAGQGLEPLYLTGRTGVVFSPKLTHAGSAFHPMVVRQDGAVVLPMRRLLTRTRFGDSGTRQELYEEIKAIPGIAVTDAGMTGFPKIPLASLVESEPFGCMLSALDSIVAVIRES